MKSFSLKNILVPTDFSAIARHGLAHAEQLAKRAGARITLLNVCEPMGDTVGTSGMAHMVAKLEERARTAHIRKLQRLADAVAERSGVPVSARVVTGRVGSAIAVAAKEVRADLIVMGTHGAHGFVDRFLGTTTYRVAASVSIPLLGVHRRPTPTGYRRIVYPVRESARALEKLSHAVALGQLFNASVDILGLIQPEAKMQEKAMRDRCAEVQRRFLKQGIKARVEYTYAVFFPEAVVRYAHKRRGSLVLIVPDADFHLVEVFQGTFAKNVLQTVLAPVLIIPRQNNPARRTEKKRSHD